MSRNSPIALLEYRLANLIRMSEAINRRRKYPLERAHYLILVYLRKGALSVRELAAKLALDDSTVTRQLNAMGKRGLIEKQINPADGRSALIVRTESGQNLAETMHHLRIDRIDNMLKGWKQKDINTLTDLIGRLNDALVQSLGAPDSNQPFDPVD